MTYGNIALPDLPVELLQNIAVYLPFSSILSLSLTSKQLFAACYHRHVFKRKAVNAIFDEKYHNMASLHLDDVEVEDWELQTCDSEASEEASDGEEWWSGVDEEISPEEGWDYTVSITQAQYKIEKAHAERIAKWPDRTVFDKLSASDSARVAFAVEKAQQWFNVPLDYQPIDRSINWREGDFASWLPHLVTTRHPSVFTMKPEHFHFLLCKHGQTGRFGFDKNSCLIDYLGSAYCIAVLTLTRIETLATAPGRIWRPVTNALPFDSGPFGLALPDVLLFFSWVMTRNKVRLDYEDRYTTVIYMIFRILAASRPHDVPLPLVGRLPLRTILENPIPFRTPAISMHDIRLTPQETIDFLNGTWVGWYATQADDYINPKLSRPQSMQIAAREATSSDHSDCITIIKGQLNSDKSASTLFHGSVNIRGEVSIVYTYEKERSLWPNHDIRKVGREDRCHGYITPFGIVGWLDPGDRVEHYVRDMSDIFWMYKEDWSHREE